MLIVERYSAHQLFAACSFAEPQGFCRWWWWSHQKKKKTNEICGSFARSKLLCVPIKEMKIWHWHVCRESQAFVAFTAVVLSGGQLLPAICLRGVFFPDICITELVVDQYLSVFFLMFVSRDKCLPNICLSGRVVALYVLLHWSHVDCVSAILTNGVATMMGGAM